MPLNNGTSNAKKANKSFTGRCRPTEQACVFWKCAFRDLRKVKVLSSYMRKSKLKGCAHSRKKEVRCHERNETILQRPRSPKNLHRKRPTHCRSVLFWKCAFRGLHKVNVLWRYIRKTKLKGQRMTKERGTGEAGKGSSRQWKKE